MTNKEIEKRFLFDLEIGTFNTRESGSDCNYGKHFAFTEYRYGYYENIKRIIKILKNNGYKLDTYKDLSFTKMMKFDRISILIDNRRKRFRRVRYLGNYYKDEIHEYLNEIPDYVKKYSLD